MSATVEPPAARPWATSEVDPHHARLVDVVLALSVRERAEALSRSSRLLAAVMPGRDA